MYVWMGNFRGLHRQNGHPDIHTRRLTIHFMCFWTFLSKNVCLAEDIEFRVFDKTADFLCMYVYFLGLHGDKDINV